MDTQQWRFIRNGVEAGPVDSATLVALAKKGKLAKDTPLRLEGDEQWHVAGNVEGLFIEADFSFEGLVAAIAPPARPAAFDPSPRLCPHCWAKFPRAETLFVARHAELVGDAVLGSDAPARFLPSRFTPEGHALDARGVVCPDMACPRCHLRLPESVMDLDSTILSIVGAPQSGKSYFLTAMLWRLRRLLPAHFYMSLADADTVVNAVVNDYERLLFLDPSSKELVAIRKTEEQGELYDQVNLDGQLVSLPKPFVFVLSDLAAAPGNAHNLVFYDNAGEQFQPGKDSALSPGSLHIVHSDGLIFLFDPACDAKLRARCPAGDPQLAHASQSLNQETILAEMANRVRKHRAMRSDQRDRRPLIVNLAKYDLWESLLPIDLESFDLWVENPGGASCQVDFNSVLNVSYHVRALLLELAPELVATAEAFSERTLFVPSSALGSAPELESGFIGVRPAKLKPVWAEAPALALLAALGQLPVSFQGPPAPLLESCQILDNALVFPAPGTGKRVQLPALYAGATLWDAQTQLFFQLPGEPGQAFAPSGSHPAADGFWDKE